MQNLLNQLKDKIDELACPTTGCKDCPHYSRAMYLTYDQEESNCKPRVMMSYVEALEQLVNSQG